ncbi:MAG: HelD family protein, partial [Acidimicrobiia bacterium]
MFASPTPADVPDGELAAERRYVAGLYRRLDELRARASRHLAATLGAGAGGTAQWRSERDSLAHVFSGRVAELQIGDLALCFGRLDLVPGSGGLSQFHIGRLALADDAHEPLLVDWRAPAARPFYQATPGDPQGVARRRHLLTRGREVTGLDDEVFDLASLSEEDRAGLQGDAALLAALRRPRTGRMGDIVATIQAEQDRIIRADLRGVLVVEGGPGTGKTAVALHRAAYLLYAHRAHLSRTGVLIVGPNSTFLRYIDQVLPSLGETGVVLCTPGELFPGVVARRHDCADVAAVKGDARMVGLLRRAVADRQRAPRADLMVEFEGERLVLTRRRALS